LVFPRTLMRASIRVGGSVRQIADGPAGAWPGHAGRTAQTQSPRCWTRSGCRLSTRTASPHEFSGGQRQRIGNRPSTGSGPGFPGGRMRPVSALDCLGPGAGAGAAGRSAGAAWVWPCCSSAMTCPWYAGLCDRGGWCSIWGARHGGRAGRRGCWGPSAPSLLPPRCSRRPQASTRSGAGNASCCAGTRPARRTRPAAACFRNSLSVGAACVRRRCADLAGRWADPGGTLGPGHRVACHSQP